MSPWHKPDPPEPIEPVAVPIEFRVDKNAYRRRIALRKFENNLQFNEQDATLLGHTLESLELLRKQLRHEVRAAAAERESRTIRKRVLRWLRRVVDG